MKSKVLWLFLLKAVVLYALLAAPVPAFDESFGDAYRKLAKQTFGKFRETGFVIFNPTKDPAVTHANMGNYALRLPDGSFDTASVDINTRFLGYLPLVLLVALVIASPVTWKRKLIALAIGGGLTLLLVLFKHWISLLWLSHTTPWLKLTDFSGFSLKLLTFTNTFISTSSFTIPYFVVGIWLLVTFRVDDFRKFLQAVKPK